MSKSLNKIKKVNKVGTKLNKVKKTIIRKGILLLLFSALSGVLKSVEAQDSNTTMNCS